MHEPRWPAAWVALLVVVVVAYWAWDPVRVSPREVEAWEETQEPRSAPNGSGTEDPRRPTGGVRWEEPELQPESQPEAQPESQPLPEAEIPETESPESESPKSAISDSQPVEPGEREAQSRPETYTVRSGDTLGAIAFRVYGSTRYVDLIFEANRDVLRSKDDLALGQVLVLPAIPEGE